MLIQVFYQSLLRIIIDRFGTPMPILQEPINGNAAATSSSPAGPCFDADRAQNERVFELQWDDILSTWIMLIAISESDESQMARYLE